MRKIILFFTLLLFGNVALLAQTQVVSGKITGPNGAVPNASVLEKGTQNGVSANANGVFTITVKKGARLVITATGFAQQEVASAANVTVTMTTSTQELATVVVTALGIKRDVKATGYSVANISTQELTQAKATNVASALSGKVSGLQVNSVNNGVTSDTRIVLRGERSITGNNQALIVIDNVPVSASYLNSLNPDDIENVSILKGANAAALYGSDGANGVILITSKKGVRAKPTITFTHTTSIEKVSFFPELNDRFGAGSTEPDSLSAYTGYFGRIPYENQMYGPEYDGRTVALGYAKRLTRANGSTYDTTQQIPYTYKDPLGHFFATGRTIQNGISYQAGDQNGSFFFSGQFNNTTGTVPKDVSNRYSVRLGASRIYNKFTSSFSIGYTKFETNVAGTDYNQARPVYWNVLNTPGEVPINNYKDLSAPFANENDWYNAYYPNPYWQIENSRVKSTQDDILGSVEFNYKPKSWINFTYRVGATARNFQQKNTQAGVTFSEYEIADPFGAGGTPSGAPNGIKPLEFDAINERFILQSDFLINMEKKFVHNDLDVRLLLGNSVTKNTVRALQTGNNQLEIPGLYNVSNVVGIPTVAESIGKTGKIGAFASLQLGWKNFLFLEATGRNDWVSVLAAENRSFFYPGLNASFVFTDAIKSLKSIPWLSFGKVTASITKVGNVSLGAYELSNTFSQAQGFPYGGLTGFTQGNTLANSNIKPEFIKAREIGLQLSFLKRRITVGITAYDEDISDQTVPVQISSSTGYTATNQNVGNVSNQGLEFDLKLNPVVNIGPVKFNLSGNLSLYKDKVDVIDPKVKSLTIGGFTTGAIYTIEGQPMRVLQVTDYLRDSLGRIIVSATT
ncbi:MAG: SusC/RagA family TonB-linked outer membrane protein, partial [Ferruginibacter sp.]